MKAWKSSSQTHARLPLRPAGVPVSKELLGVSDLSSPLLAHTSSELTHSCFRKTSEGVIYSFIPIIGVEVSRGEVPQWPTKLSLHSPTCPKASKFRVTLRTCEISVLVYPDSMPVVQASFKLTV